MLTRCRRLKVPHPPVNLSDQEGSRISVSEQVTPRYRIKGRVLELNLNPTVCGRVDPRTVTVSSPRRLWHVFWWFGGWGAVWLCCVYLSIYVNRVLKVPKYSVDSVLRSDSCGHVSFLGIWTPRPVQISVFIRLCWRKNRTPEYCSGQRGPRVIRLSLVESKSVTRSVLCTPTDSDWRTQT